MWYDVYAASIWAVHWTLLVFGLILLYKAIAHYFRSIRKPPKRLPAYSWRVVHIALGVTLFCVLVRVVAGYASAWELRREAKALAAELTTFADERQKLLPSSNTRDWNAYTRTFSRQEAETRSLYAERYAARVMLLREEFARRDLIDSDLDMFYLNPSDPSVVRRVADRLAYMAKEMP